MHAFPMQKLEAPEMKPAEEQAEHVAYRSPDGKLYVPSVAMQRCVIGAASYSKGKGRSTLQKPVAACVLVSPEYLILDQQAYGIDARPVVNPTTKGRVVRFRPRFDEWSFEGVVEFDDVLLKESELKRIFDDAGTRVGLLDFRPERKGPFGRFMVTLWKTI
jgi:hypothetical protein